MTIVVLPPGCWTGRCESPSHEDGRDHIVWQLGLEGSHCHVLVDRLRHDVCNQLVCLRRVSLQIASVKHREDEHERRVEPIYCTAIGWRGTFVQSCRVAPLCECGLDSVFVGGRLRGHANAHAQ